MLDSKLLTAAERRSRIVQLVLEREMVRVADMVRDFGVTDTVIRRDLVLLESERRLRRIHGGAVATPGHQRAESFTEKMRMQMAEKQRIGAAAAELIEPGEVLLFDSGTTTLQVVMSSPPPLRAANALTFVTNSFPIVEEMHAWPAPNLILLGGMYLPDYQATVGPQAVSHLLQFTADKVFLGADGLTLEGGITTAHVLMAEVGRLMAERARQVIVVTDSSKLGRAGFVPIVPLNRIHRLITDSNAPAELVSAIRTDGIEVTLV
ncbi:MAG: DeoR/GlpR transcriptional regulator [Chloroflexi bacterium]|nr:DeoR/GlpR transcriptional regulator [Chloroflexota bacterium]